MGKEKPKKSVIRSILSETVLIMILLAILLDIIAEPANKKKEEETTIADGFTIEKYNLVLDVKSDNKVDVTENITVNFTKAGKHGIYKFTPFWLEYTGKNEKTIKRLSSIINYRAEGDPYSVDTIKNKARIKIGSADKYVDYGNKEYTIKYTYDLGKDPFKGFDEFIFHAYGDYWGTEIKNASIEVNMPKSIEGYNVNFFTDKYRKNNNTDVVDYKVSGNTLYASFNSEKYYQKQLEEYQNIYGENNTSQFSYKPLTNSLTLDIELPEGYFTGGSWNYGFISFAISIIIFILTALTIYKWFKYGKDYEKKAQTVEFYPPDNLNAAEIGYVFNNHQSSKKYTISLIIQLASKGYIKIDEIENKKIQITNLVPQLKESIKSQDKSIDEENIKEGINSPVELPELSNMETKVYNRLFEKKDKIILSEHETFYMTFSEIQSELNKTFKDKVHDKESKEQLSEAIYRNVLILILSMISYRYIKDLDPNWGIFYILSFVCVFINLFFTIFMKRKTEYGESITSRVKGFRDYLITAEKEGLEELVARNPYYYYNILPYTYVLNISKKWIKKFEDIPIPKIEMGNFDYGSDYAYSHFYNDIYYPTPTYSSSGGGSGCSSCGGGCSSCGGGCSSCGGGGSW